MGSQFTEMSWGYTGCQSLVPSGGAVPFQRAPTPSNPRLQLREASARALYIVVFGQRVESRDPLQPESLCHHYWTSPPLLSRYGQMQACFSSLPGENFCWPSDIQITIYPNNQTSHELYLSRSPQISQPIDGPFPLFLYPCIFLLFKSIFPAISLGLLEEAIELLGPYPPLLSSLCPSCLGQNYLLPSTTILCPLYT